MEIKSLPHKTFFILFVELNGEKLIDCIECNLSESLPVTSN